MSVRIPVFDYEAKKVEWYARSRWEVEELIRKGQAYKLSDQPFQVALIAPKRDATRNELTKQVWLPAASLTVPPEVIEAAAEGRRFAKAIIDGYGSK